MKVTAHVSAGCYPASHKAGFLTHRAEIGAGVPEVKAVSCRRVKASSILPDSSTYSQERPTCSVCARAFDREAK
jgi:hypothetical protein